MGVAIAVLVLRLPYLPAFTATERVVLVQLHGALAAPLILGMRGPGRAGLRGCGPPANDRSAVRETLTTMDAEPDPGAQAQAERQAQAMYAEDRASQGLGIAITDVAPGRATATLLVTAAMVNGHGTCHGGYLFLLADTAFAFACNTHGDPAVAAGADVTFLAAVHEGEHLVAEAVERVVHGRSGLYDVTVRRDGQPVVEFRGRSRTLSGRRPTSPPS